MNKKIKSLSIALGTAVVVGAIGISFVFAKSKDESVTEQSDTKINYENEISVYENLLAEFNTTHGTTYEFPLSDDSLESLGKTREEAVKEIYNEYGSMTQEEFMEYLEKAYENDKAFEQSLNESKVFSWEKPED